MKISINNNVWNRIEQFYLNAMKKYPNTYTLNNAEKDWNKVKNEAYKVGTQLSKKMQHGIKNWKNYNVDYSSNTGWNFAYRIVNNTIIVEDAANYRNMSNKAHQFQNQNQQSNNVNQQPQQQNTNNKTTNSNHKSNTNEFPKKVLV